MAALQSSSHWPSAGPAPAARRAAAAAAAAAEQPGDAATVVPGAVEGAGWAAKMDYNRIFNGYLVFIF